MNAGFDPRALEARFAPLDRLGRRLWLPAIVNTQGEPVERLAALDRMRARLLAGTPPFEDADAWPDGQVRAAFRAPCDALGLAALARAHEEVTEQVLRSLLWHLDRIAWFEARMPRAGAIEHCAREFAGDWEERNESLREILRVFESLDGVANFARWSEIRGLLQSESWQGVLAARERIAHLPGLAAVIRRLGRARPVPDEALTEVAGTQAGPAEPEWVRRTRDVEMPGVPLETEGIRRSGDFGRMLASEAILLRRRRRLLAAKLAEQTLLTYQHRQFWRETTWVREPGPPRAPAPRPRPVTVAGPMILCVDTSSSMSGAPELIAKAVVLEAMRVAAAERRACMLYAFSGPGDLAVLDLSLRLDGVLAVARFLGESFHGGTDVCEPFERAIDAVATKQWREADLLIATDGEFGAPPALRERLERAKSALGLRVQGALIGDRETIAMRTLCDDVFWVREWRRFRPHVDAAPPIHASDLTRRYFPGAFARDGAGADAAAAAAAAAGEVGAAGNAADPLSPRADRPS